MAPKVLISDALSPAAVQIFKDRGVEVDFQPKLGADKEKLAELIGQFDGLAIRSATKVTPKIFRMTKGGKISEDIFEGATINTPSMLCVEDYLDTLNWAKSVGGLKALIGRADANAGAVADWVARTPWIEFLANDPAIRSNTSVCLKVVDPAVLKLPADAQAKFVKGIAAALEKEGIAYDIDAYRDAPPGLRIWCGSTAERADVEALTHWLDWAFAKSKDALPKAA